MLRSQGAGRKQPRALIAVIGAANGCLMEKLLTERNGHNQGSCHGHLAVITGLTRHYPRISASRKGCYKLRVEAGTSQQMKIVENGDE